MLARISTAAVIAVSLGAGLFASASPRSRVSSAVTQSDLDAFMQKVLAKRDENWKKLQQYVLEERERLQLTEPDGARLFGLDREYFWFPRDGIFVRSPVRADGVAITEGERRKEEDAWLAQQRARKDDEPEFIKAALTYHQTEQPMNSTTASVNGHQTESNE